MLIINILHELISKAAPIYGVSIGDENNKDTWTIDFKPEAADQQRATALQIMADFDVQTARLKIQRIADRERDAEAQAGLATQLKTVTPQQAVNYIEANVTNLATAKEVLKIMARMLIAIRDRVFPELPE